MKKPRFLTTHLQPILAAVFVVSVTASMHPVALAVTPVGTPAAVPGKDSAGQSSQAGKISESRAQQEQRRVELRAALRDQKRKNDEAAKAASAVSDADTALKERHLNARQRAEMRQQLAQQGRQQRLDSANAKP